MVGCPAIAQRIEDRGAEAAFGMVVLGHDEPAPSGDCRGGQGRGVDRLDRVQVDDAGGDAFVLRARRRRPGSCAGLRRRRSASPGPLRWSAAPSSRRPGNVSLSGVQHWVGAPGGAHVADARVSAISATRRGAGGVAGVQHGGAVHGPHHRQVLQRHLRRAVRADLDAGVGAGQPQVAWEMAAIRMKS